MCGKFTAVMTWGEYCDLAGVSTSGTDSGLDAMDPTKMLGTFTPMSNIPVLHLSVVGMRRITPMRWGWYNHKLADPRKGFSHLHARSEGIDRTPTWVEPFHDYRGVVFTKSFNIGEEQPNGKTKQWVCSRADAQPVAIAVLYSPWETPFGKIHTCVMVTTESCSPLSTKDSRMPALLRDAAEISAWLGATDDTTDDIKTLLRPFDGSLVMREQESSTPPKTKSSKPTEKRPAKTSKEKSLDLF